jgi:hypothetical protein
MSSRRANSRSTRRIADFAAHGHRVQQGDDIALLAEEIRVHLATRSSGRLPVKAMWPRLSGRTRPGASVHAAAGSCRQGVFAAASVRCRRRAPPAPAANPASAVDGSLLQKKVNSAELLRGGSGVRYSHTQPATKYDPENSVPRPEGAGLRDPMTLSSRSSPMPDSIKTFGVLMAPRHRITSQSPAPGASRPRGELHADDRVPSNCSRCTVACSSTVKLVRHDGRR